MKNLYIFLAALITALFCVSVLSASDPSEIIGTASVIDGDTIDIHGERIRLHGIDSPEGRQRCIRGGEEWRCGTDASNAVSEFIGRSSVVCTVVDVDRYKRKVATCSVRGADINLWMVEQGWAVAYRQYSHAYDRAEDAARLAERGVWSSKFEMPWDWRKNN
jgi:endonuclease YncB( thermonuclease family)